LAEILTWFEEKDMMRKLRIPLLLAFVVVVWSLYVTGHLAWLACPTFVVLFAGMLYGYASGKLGRRR